MCLWSFLFQSKVNSTPIFLTKTSNLYAFFIQSYFLLTNSASLWRWLWMIQGKQAEQKSHTENGDSRTTPSKPQIVATKQAAKSNILTCHPHVFTEQIYVTNGLCLYSSNCHRVPPPTPRTHFRGLQIPGFLEMFSPASKAGPPNTGPLPC